MNAKKANKIRILLVDDHLIVRMGIKSVLSFEDDMEIVGETDNGLDAIRMTEELVPDIILMDLQMPRLGGVEATAKILKKNSSAKILILTTFGSSAELKRALDIGAAGAIVKSSSPDEIVEAIHGVLSDKAMISDEILHTMENIKSTPEMSQRQIEILNLIAKGFSNKEIANILSVSLETVKDHVKKILSKIGASSRTEAASLAINLKLITA